MKSNNKNTTVHILAKQAKKRLTLIAQGGDKNNNILSREDSKLYEKVIKILSNNKIVTNPINELIDKEYYEALTQEGKQRYIMYLSEKYVKLKQRYINSTLYKINSN